MSWPTDRPLTHQPQSGPKRIALLLKYIRKDTSICVIWGQFGAISSYFWDASSNRNESFFVSIGAISIRRPDEYYYLER